MNLLTDALPEEVEIGGRFYPIDTDFTTGVKFDLLACDEEIPESEKIDLAVNLYFPDPPEDTGEALKAIHWFYSGGEEPRHKKKQGGFSSERRIYDFNYDASYIYAAFRSDYGIDLTRERLHWWVFRALFAALREDNMICKIMSYRAADLSKLKGEELKFYRKKQKEFAIPAPKSERDKLSAVEHALLNGGDVSKVLETYNSM